jgi:phosphatidate cytidylyltransferase
MDNENKPTENINNQQVNVVPKKSLIEKFADSKQRIISAIILAPIVIGIILFGGIPFIIMMSACAAISIHEWGNMTLSDIKDKVDEKIMPFSIACAVISVFITGFAGNPATTLWIVLAFCFFILSFNISRNGPNINRFIFGIIYMVFSIEVMVWIRNFAPHGLFHIMTLLLMVWASDTFAYIFGKSIGGPKLAPVISPKKTWSGFFGSSIGAGTVAALLTTCTTATLGGMTWVGYFVMGFILGMFGQAGDLLISLVKRHYKIKDTGNIIPGHGGILDRIDALLFVAIIFGMLVVVFQR